MHHEIRKKARVKAVLLMPCHQPCSWPQTSSQQFGLGSRVVNCPMVAELTVQKVQKALSMYVFGRNQFQKGKSIVLKLRPQSQNRWMFLQKQTGELTCWHCTLNSRIQSQQKVGENISSDLFIYLIALNKTCLYFPINQEINRKWASFASVFQFGNADLMQFNQHGCGVKYPKNILHVMYFSGMHLTARWNRKHYAQAVFLIAPRSTGEQARLETLNRKQPKQLCNSIKRASVHTHALTYTYYFSSFLFLFLLFFTTAFCNAVVFWTYLLTCKWYL